MPEFVLTSISCYLKMQTNNVFRLKMSARQKFNFYKEMALQDL